MDFFRVFTINRIIILLLLIILSSVASLSFAIDGMAAEKELYLIIRTDEYATSPALSAFIAFRKQTFNVQVVSGSEIGVTKDDYRNYVRELMPSYLLLVGDYGDFPSHSLDYFGKMIESYNYYTASSLAGHPHPDIPLGLFLVENEGELSNIVYKTIYTENNIASYPCQYYAHAGSNEPVWPWPVEFNELILTEMNDRFFEPQGFSFTMSTALDDSPNDVWTDIAMINNGIKYMIYHGHGAIHKWSFGLGVGGLPQLYNTVYPFIFSFSCSTGSFSGEVNGVSRDCLARKIIACEHGAVAFFGAYNTSGRGMNPLMEGVVSGLFTEGVHRLGDALIIGYNNTANPETVDLYYPNVTEDERTKSAWQFHLFGDPAVAIGTFAGDLNNDMRVNLRDFAVMSSQWLSVEEGMPADIVDGDPEPGRPRVDIDDLKLLLSDWLKR
jgi:hypothetical protein